jgi:hypothetical protein
LAWPLEVENTPELRRNSTLKNLTSVLTLLRAVLPCWGPWGSWAAWAAVLSKTQTVFLFHNSRIVTIVALLQDVSSTRNTVLLCVVCLVCLGDFSGQPPWESFGDVEAFREFRVYAKGPVSFDFGILILKVNRTFVMKKITLRGPKLTRSSHPIVVLFRSNF